MAFSILVATPPHLCDAGLAIAAARAGETGLLDLGLHAAEGLRAGELARLRHHADGRGSWGARWDTLGHRMPEGLSGLLPTRLPWLLVAGLDGGDPGRLRAALEQARTLAERVLLEVYDDEAALGGARLGCDGLVLAGSESGGRIGARSSFLWLQAVHGRLDLPYWVKGAWGPETAAAARLAGAEGVVLGEELWLSRESPLGIEERDRLASLDGSETVCLGDERATFRLFAQADREGLAELEREAESGGDWPRALHDRWLDRRDDAPPASRRPLPMGQGVAFAARLAARYVTTGGILGAFRSEAASRLERVAEQRSLAAGAPLAQAHGTRYPVLQGPMTRVSDVSAFCDAVSRNGALPFLALALMRGAEAGKLLAETGERMGDRPWGVGILGFVPPELRREQLEAIESVRPRFAIIAGGHPGQARSLEESGVATYIHVPSPGLLASFLEQGARRFILEGRECGGHVGPRSSFLLWQSAIDVLLDAGLDDPGEAHLVFAGGIHDALSSAMVQTLAAALVERGVKIGVLMGTAYLFTHEAVNCGAITPVYQEQALACRKTALLRSGLGHATRCAETTFAAEFEELRRRRLGEGLPAEQIRFELEMLNVGRLRIASKALARLPADDRAAGEDGASREALLARGDRMLGGALTPVGEESQRRDGMFMIGEVATLRERTVTMAELHRDVCDRGTDTAARLAERVAPRVDPRQPCASREPIAIVGLACRFPGSPDARTYWENILTGFDAVREVPPERWRPDGLYSEDPAAEDRTCSKWGSFLEPCRFDPLAYGIPPATAPSIEPIQLLSLDVAAAAVRDAGYEERPFRRDRTAVIFAAGGVNDVGMNYVVRTVLPHYLDRVGGLDEQTKERVVEGVRRQLPRWTEDSFPGFLLNVLSGRVANRLDLQGPNFVVDAACAASLAALHTAMDLLRAETCDTALVGAADATNNPFMFTCFAKTHALTPSGRIRPFDDRADGIVLGEGVAAIVLKRLGDAERDGDRIYAVIRGIGSSSDGRNRSLTAPHATAQRLAIQRAYDDAGVDPTTVSLIEAHATGTAVGDRSEIEAMKPVFETAERTEPFCAVGSVKSNIGHTKTVAGLAGLIKTVLALRHRVLPPTIHVEVPNRQVDFDSSPFYISSEARPWTRRDPRHARRAGVSAFGFGGTNFHVVLEEYTGDYHSSSAIDYTPRSAEVFLWRRPDVTSLVRELGRLEDSLARVPEIRLGQLAYATHLEERQRRQAGGDGARAAIVATSIEDLRAKLRTVREAAASGTALPDGEDLHVTDAPAARPEEVCFLFPGQGSQRVGMLEELARSGPFGVDILEYADGLLADLLPERLSSYIYPRPGFDRDAKRRRREALDDTRIAQPAIGLISVLGSDILQSLGLRPAFAAGHSYGEHVALSAMGLLTRDDLLRSSAIRGRAVPDAGRDHPGGMVAVAASEEQTRAALDELGIPASIANVNAPRQVVIAGPLDAVEAALKRLPERGLAVRRVAVTAAFHSAAMERPSESFGEHLEKLEMHVPRIPVYSNVTAEPYPSDVEAIRRLMSVHLARPVRFVDQIRAMHRDGARLFFEVGPGRVLTGLVKRILEGRPHAAIALDVPGQPGWRSLGRLLAGAHARGLPVKLDAWFAGRGHAALRSEECLEQARRRAEGRPTDWIVDAGGARPARALPETGHDRPPVAEAPAPTVTNLEHDGTTTSMKRDAHPDRAVLAELNTAMQKWLELQREQRRLSERFLAVQERIVAGLLGEPPPGAGRGPETEAGDADALRVSPAPVLPEARPLLDLPDAEGDDRDAAGAESRTPGPAADVAADLPAGAEKPPTVERFRTDLLAEVARRTGYPEEMLDLDVQLERDLGIDSIKVMEIFGGLKGYHAVFSDDREVDEEVLVQLAQCRTLRDIVDYFVRRLEGASGAPEPAVERPRAARRPAPLPGTAATTIERLVLRSVPAPRPEQASFGTLPAFPRHQILLMLGEPPELASSVDAALTASGHRVVRIIPGSRFAALGGHRYEADLADGAGLRRLAERIRGADGARVGALVNLLGLGEPLGRPGLNGVEAPLRLVQWLTNVAQTFEEDLRACGREGGGRLINVTSLDGRFGLRGSGDLPVAQAGSLGFFKSLAREWRGARVKNLDLDPAADPRALLVGLLQEMACGEGRLEIGLDDVGRWQLELEPAPAEMPERADPRALPLAPESVVLATGGADGITFEVLQRLAAEARCRIVVVGRTTSDGRGLPAGLEGVHDEQGLRSALIERSRTERGTVTPAEIEKDVQRVLKLRRIRRNLDLLRAAGSEVEYHAIDVRDAASFGSLIDSLYERFGRIDGVLHGAGVIEDCRLRDKTPESLARVFGTKVASAHTLASRLRQESVRFVVFFSSVSGRFGNAGQSDYSAANEYLNKLAAHLDRTWSGRVVSINWGPWDSGMLSDGLRTAYAERGIGLIRAEEGARSLLDELRGSGERASEVMLTCTPQRIAGLDEQRG